MGVPSAAFGDAPASNTTTFQALMEAQAEWVYDNDTPYAYLDPNGEPDGANEPTVGGVVSGDWPPAWQRGGAGSTDVWPASLVIADNNANGIPDVMEFDLIKVICDDTGNTSHALVHEAFKKNFGYVGSNLGLAGGMVPTLKYMMAAYILVGDGSYSRFRYPVGPCPTNCTEYGYNFSGSWGIVAETISGMNDVFANGWRPYGTSGCATCDSAPNDTPGCATCGGPTNTKCDRMPDLFSAVAEEDGGDGGILDVLERA